MADAEPSYEEPIDVIASDPAATAWRRAARRHQADWRVAHGWPAGSVTIPRTKAAREAGVASHSRPIASRVDVGYARATGCNFLTNAALAAVEDRLRNKQPHETLDATRLYADLLSSMPMCFNLFGPLQADPSAAQAVVDRWFPDLALPDAPIAISFEWSPGRRDPLYLGDRTAFDAVIRIGPENGGNLIGIETKYHEYPITDRRAGGEEPPTRYVEVSAKAELFRSPDGVAKVWGTAMEQVWRDHLLALACQQHDLGPSRAKYVLIAPASNPPWERLIADYQNLLTDAAAATITFIPLEDFVRSGALPHAALLRSRYMPSA